MLLAVASERNQHCGGEAKPEGPKLEARRAEPGSQILGEELSTTSCRGFAGTL